MQDDFLFITSRKKLYKVKVSAIVLVEAMDDYIRIKTRNSRVIVTRMTMKAMSEQLDHRQFIRIHRSYIIPVKSIQSLGTHQLVAGGNELPLGKTYAAAVRKAFTGKD